MSKSIGRHPRPLHPLAVRIMHWVNALAMLVMIGSGWTIYNDEVLIGWLHFPDWARLGGGMQYGLQWHFAAMWVLVLNGLCYLAYGLLTGRFRRKFLPVWPGAVLREIGAALRFRLSHQDIRSYNAVQKLLYLGVILVIVLQVLTGLAIWKPVQFSELASVFGSFQTGRWIHFLGMVAIVGFLAVHIALALLVPRTLGAMITGGPHESREAESSQAAA